MPWRHPTSRRGETPVTQTDDTGPRPRAPGVESPPMRRALLASFAVLAACASPEAPPPAAPAAAAAPAPAPAPPPAPAPRDVTTTFDVVFGDRLAGKSVLVRHADGSLDEDFEFNDRGRGPKLTRAHGARGRRHPEQASSGAARTTSARRPRARDVRRGAVQMGQRSRARRGAARLLRRRSTTARPNEALLRAARAATGGALRSCRAARCAREGRGGQVSRPARGGTCRAWELAGFGLDAERRAGTTTTARVRRRRRSRFGAPRRLEGAWRQARRRCSGRSGRRGARASRRRSRTGRTGGSRSCTRACSIPTRRRRPRTRRSSIEGDKSRPCAPKLAPPAGSEVLDAEGKTVLPGLWDMHVHLDDDDGLLQLAEGITTVRDLGNDLDVVGHRVARGGTRGATSARTCSSRGSSTGAARCRCR